MHIAAHDDTQWLTFWSVYVVFNCMEEFGLRYVIEWFTFVRHARNFSMFKLPKALMTSWYFAVLRNKSYPICCHFLWRVVRFYSLGKAFITSSRRLWWYGSCSLGVLSPFSTA